MWPLPPVRFAMPAHALKRCTKCGQVRPLADFSPAKGYRGGRKTQCKACHAAYMRRWRREHLEHARARARLQNRKRRAWLAAYRRNPDRRLRQAVRNASYWAVEAGLLPRKDRCERCGAGGPRVRLNRHHPDYADPLRIEWLCTRCHGEVHGKTP